MLSSQPSLKLHNSFLLEQTAKLRVLRILFPNRSYLTEVSKLPYLTCYKCNQWEFILCSHEREDIFTLYHDTNMTQHLHIFAHLYVNKYNYSLVSINIYSNNFIYFSTQHTFKYPNNISHKIIICFLFHFLHLHWIVPCHGIQAIRGYT